MSKKDLFELGKFARANVYCACAFFVSSLLMLSCSLCSYGQTQLTSHYKTPVPTAPYTWKSVPIGGGGFVDGIIFHPKAKGVRYCRTDMGGAYRWNDQTKTWEPVPSHPTQYRPTHAVLAKDGMLYLTYGDNPGPAKMSNGAVWKLNTHTSEWTEITPDRPDPAQNRTFGYAAIAVDVHHPNRIIASTYNRYQAGGEELFKTSDGGKTWKGILKTSSRFDHSSFPYVARTGVHWMFDIEIDPFDPDHALFTTGYGGHETYNLTDADKGKKVVWTVMNKGIEETVALELLSPPKGAHLISAIGDYGGFVHRDLNQVAPEGNFTNPHFGNTDGVVCAESNPNVIVRVGVASHQQATGKNIGYSLDGGKTWQPTASMPQANSQHGHIAISADGRTWIWTPQRSSVYLTQDQGTTWIKANGIPDNLRVVADRVNPLKFYALSLFEGALYISTDGGKNFQKQVLSSTIKVPVTRTVMRGDPRGGQDRVYATPGQEGDLWLALYDGLYHSTDEGKTFTKAMSIQEIHAFGFGKAAPNTSYAALYLVGVVNGVRGIFRSDDGAESWLRINDDQHQWGMILHVTGDPKVWGRVYIGTHGRGILWGMTTQPSTINKKNINNKP